MALLQRSTRTTTSGNSLTKPAPGQTGNVSGLSLDQARLNAIAFPTPAYWNAYVRWLNRLTFYPETYPDEELRAEQARLKPEIADLHKLTHDPPRDWTGDRFLSEHERLRKLEGRLGAIETVLSDRKRRPVGATSQRGSRLLNSTGDPEWDPFADC